MTVWLGLALWPVGVAGGSAQEISSVYVEFNLDRCVIVDKIEETGSIVQRCKALDGFPIFIAEDDLRFFVGYGPNGRKQKAFSQTLPQFNSIHTKIEFRIRPGARQPFAAILRYFTDNGDDKPRRQVLVVTKIAGRDDACHMAYIDALAIPDANGVAQKAADAMAGSFDCVRDQAKDIGAVGPDNR